MPGRLRICASLYFLCFIFFSFFFFFFCFFVSLSLCAFVPIFLYCSGALSFSLYLTSHICGYYFMW